MKRILVLAILFGFSGGLAAGEPGPYRIHINWDDAATLKELVVQMCDDTYYPSVEVTVPGRAGKDFAVDMEVDITSGQVSAGCSVKKKDRQDSVIYEFDAQSSCVIKVYQLRPRAGERPKTAVYEFHDAC